MRRNLKWAGIGAFGLLLFVWFNITLWGGAYFDSICIEGRLSATQAEALNGAEWGKCPSYRVACAAEENDRVIKHYCSAFTRSLWLRDNDTWKRIRRATKGLMFGERS
jgi:hypothetical protein